MKLPIGWTVVATVIAVITGLPASSFAHEVTYKAMAIVHPWVHETEVSEARLSVRLKNRGHASERLLRASTPIAETVAILDSKGMKMSGVRIPVGGELMLKSGGIQVALSGLKKPLRAYETFALTLVFERAGPVTVQVMVEEDTGEKAKSESSKTP